MKLSVWAKREGIGYQAAWQMFKGGKLPLPSHQLATGTIIVEDAPAGPNGAALYARVSSHDQKKDLEAQLGRLAAYAMSRKLNVVETVSEVGSGLNGHRRGLMRLLRDPKVQTVVVEHRDRLMRFGAEYVEATLMAQNRRLLVVDESELKDDLVQDMIAVLTSMCARLYGRRSAKNRAARAMACLQKDDA
jgi:predicted site-specific integrase-resolvase